MVDSIERCSLLARVLVEGSCTGTRLVFTY
eukprot:SAG31_NODE_8185_length_1501_cov_1.433666_1_plen_29_part_10